MVSAREERDVDIRNGTVREYRRGTTVLTHMTWEDGHEEFEIHECRPVLLYRSLEPGALEEAKAALDMAAPPVRQLPSHYTTEIEGDGKDKDSLKSV